MKWEPDGNRRYGITGWGAVSPAGWSAAELHEAVMEKRELPVLQQRREEAAPEVNVRETPAMPMGKEWMKFARMRRTTVTARHALHAAVEALGAERLVKVQQGELRVGVIFCTMNGCVQFSRKFFAEVLKEPSLASPILFPETVYNAPASHISALLGSTEINYSLVGDSAGFVAAVKMGLEWLEDELVDGVLVVAGEERDWLLDEALRLFSREAVTSEGAAAVFLQEMKEGKAEEKWVEVAKVSETWTYGNRLSPQQATRRMRDEVMVGGPEANKRVLLCDGLGKMAKGVERAEAEVWKDWQAARVSVRPVLGESYGASSGWQTVLACEALSSGEYDEAIVAATGLVQQAVGVRLVRGEEQ